MTSEEIILKYPNEVLAGDIFLARIFPGLNTSQVAYSEYMQFNKNKQKFLVAVPHHQVPQTLQEHYAMIRNAWVICKNDKYYLLDSIEKHEYL